MNRRWDIDPRRRGVTRKETRVRNRMNVSLSDPASGAVDALLTTGLFGHSRTDVVQRLIYERLRQLTVEGWLNIDHSHGDGDDA